MRFQSGTRKKLPCGNSPACAKGGRSKCSLTESRARGTDLPDDLIFRIPVKPAPREYFAFPEPRFPCVPAPFPLSSDVCRARTPSRRHHSLTRWLHELRLPVLQPGVLTYPQAPL